jgi:hypothetical protein
MKFIILSGILTGAIIGVLIVTSAQLAFADYTWTEETASGVIVHTGSDSYLDAEPQGPPWWEVMDQRIKEGIELNDKLAKEQRSKLDKIWNDSLSIWGKLFTEN